MHCFLSHFAISMFRGSRQPSSERMPHKYLSMEAYSMRAVRCIRCLKALLIARDHTLDGYLAEEPVLHFATLRRIGICQNGRDRRFA